MKKNVLAISGMAISVILVLSLGQPMGSIPALGPLLSPNIGYLQNRETPEDLNDQVFDLELSDSDVTVIMDSFLIPHIYAQNDADAFRIQGYLEAKYRLWQMDFITRVAAGRVSEVVGATALDYDKQQRRKGLTVAAERSLEAWKKYPESLAYVEAYTEGANAYINQVTERNKPIEYKLLDYKPEPWSPLKSALFFKHMANVLCSRERDFEMTNARILLGDDLYNFLYPPRNEGTMPVIPSEKVYDFEALPKEASESLNNVDLGLLLERPYESFGPGIGSNNWAVAPSKAKNGKALMANDPHLPLRLPAIWYLVHISTPTHNTMGVSFPGIPAVVLGFNDDISWGVTNVGHDVLDWLQVDWNKSKGTFTWDDQEQPLEWRVEEIKQKNGQTVIDSVAWTPYGPIWEIETAAGKSSAIMRWIATETPVTDEMSVFPNLNKATSLNEGIAACSMLNSPAQNFVFASREGQIALRVQGRYPLRHPNYGREISEAKSDNTWDSYIPSEHVPYIIDPVQSYVASANQASTDTTYPYYYINGDFRPARAITINSTLRELSAATTEDMKGLQLNAYDVATHQFMKTVVPYLADAKYQSQLSEWDGRFEADCEICVLVNKLTAEIQKLTYDELNGPENLKIEPPNIWRTTAILKATPEHIVFDQKHTEAIETAQDIVTTAYKTAEKAFDDLDDKRWYKYRNSRISHIIPSLKSFGAFDLPCGGTGYAPNALRESQGPSWRLVSELDTPIKAEGVYPGGQSGHVGSQYYDNMLPLWIKGEYITFEFPSDPEELKRPLFNIEIQ